MLSPPLDTVWAKVVVLAAVGTTSAQCCPCSILWLAPLASPLLEPSTTACDKHFLATDAHRQRPNDAHVSTVRSLASLKALTGHTRSAVPHVYLTRSSG